VPYYENLLLEKSAVPDVDCHLLIDIAEIIGDMTPANWEAKREGLLNKYLKEYLTI